MKRRTAKILVLVTLVLWVLLLLLFARTEVAFGIITGVCFVCEFIFMQFLRCPGCCRAPGREWLWAKYCPYCGESYE